MKVEKLWVVSDPTANSELSDICFETTLAGLVLQFRGGMTMSATMILFTERSEAESEAHRRLVAARVSQAIRLGAPAKLMKGAVRVALLGGRGDVIFEAALPTS